MPDPTSAAPTIGGLNGSSVSTTTGAGLALLDPGAASLVSDPNNPASFAGGSIVASLGGGFASQDELFIGTGNGIGFQYTGGVSQLTYNGAVIGTETVGSGSGGPLVVSLTGGASLAAVDAVLHEIEFESGGLGSGPRSVAVTVNDGTGAPSSQAATVTVSVAPGAPHFYGLSGGAVTAGAGPVRLTQYGGESDPNNLPSTSGAVLTVAVTGNADPGDLLGLAAVGGIAVSGSTVYDNGTAVATLSGGASSTPLTVSFNGAGGYPAGIVSSVVEAVDLAASQAGSGPRTVTLTYSDGVTGAPAGTATTTVSVAPPPPVAPTITGLNGTTVATTAGAGLVPLDPGAVSLVSDPNNPASFAGGSITASLGGGFASQDELFVGAGNGIGFQYTGGVSQMTYNGAVVGTETICSGSGGPLVVSLTGGASLAAVDAVLHEIEFESGGLGSGPRTVAVTVNDGTGAPSSPAADVTVSVAPAVPQFYGLGSGAAVTAGAGPVRLAPMGGEIDYNGPPSTSGAVLTVAITGNADPGDLLGLAAVGGIAVSGSTVYDNGTAVATLSGGASSTPLTVSFNGAGGYPGAIVDSVLDAVDLAASQAGSGPRTVTLTYSDGTGAPAGTAALQVSVSSPVVGPVIANFSGTMVATTAGAPAAVIDQRVPVVISDATAASFSGGSLTLSITGNADPNDLLGLVSANGVSVSGGTVAWNGSPIGTVTGGSAGAPLVVSFTSAGVGASVASAVLDDMTFQAAATGAGPRTLTVSVSDGTGVPAAVASATATVAPAVPTINGLAGVTLDYVIGTGPASIAAGAPAQVVEPGNPSSLSGSTLTVSITGNAAPGDQLGLQSLRGISLAGGVVQYSGVAVAHISGGGGSTPLMVKFDTAAASSAAVNAVLDDVSIIATTVAQRTITTAFTDANGVSAAPAVSAVAVGAAPQPLATVATPTVLQPQNPGDLVGFRLQNNQAQAQGSQIISFGQAFAAGQLMPGTQLIATIGGQQIPVQMDVKATNADGSVRDAILSLAAPALAANSSADAMLSVAPVQGTPPAALDLHQLLTSGYDTVLALTLHNGDGTTTPVTVHAADLLSQALQSGTAQYWMQGPEATEVRVDAPIAGSLHASFDIRYLADGTSQTDVIVANDKAYLTSGQTQDYTYDVAIQQNGQTAFSKSNVLHYLYSSWHKDLTAGGDINVVHDVNALINSGAVPAYDTSTGITQQLLQNLTSGFTAANTDILGGGTITRYMPTTGARYDIGITSQWDAAYLLSQTEQARNAALNNADGAGAVPWHVQDAQTGAYVSVTNHPDLWIDGRGGTSYGTTGIPLSSNTGGFTPDSAHEPDLSYIPYLLTGTHYYLDQLQAQASWDIASYWPGPRQNGLGILAADNQVRAAAWALRDVGHAAYISPDSSALKGYFSQIAQNNVDYLNSTYTTNTNEGQVAGWIQDGGTNGHIAEWQQDFLATSIAQLAGQDVSGAAGFLAWEQNFLAGLFTNGPNGFDPHDGAAGAVATYVPNTAYQALTSWAQVEAAMQAAGLSGNGQWPAAAFPGFTEGYVANARAALADLVSQTQAPQAIQAYTWVVANDPLLTGQAYAGDVNFSLSPRLADGQFLLDSNIHVSTDLTDTTITGSNADELLAAGAGNDLLQGGNGINLMLAGSGADTLTAGSGNDFLFGGAGPDRLSAGGGTNWLQAGTGAATFVLNEADAAHDTIAGFRTGVDLLEIHQTDLTVNGLIAGATSTGAGSAVLHLSPTHDVTLNGIAVGQLSAAMFRLT